MCAFANMPRWLCLWARCRGRVSLVNLLHVQLLIHGARIGFAQLLFRHTLCCQVIFLVSYGVPLSGWQESKMRNKAIQKVFLRIKFNHRLAKVVCQARIKESSPFRCVP